MPPKLKSSRSSDEQSEDSLIAEINRRQCQRKLTNYLSDKIQPSPEVEDISQKLKPNFKSHSGFTNASQIFRAISNQKPQLNSIGYNNQRRVSKSIDETKATIPNQQIKSKDSKLNKQLIEPILKDIEDVGNHTGKDCNGCQQKSSVSGLSYKQRNRKLIQEHQQKFYQQKQHQGQSGLNTPKKNEMAKNQTGDFKQSLNQFQFNQNQPDLPENQRIKQSRQQPPTNKNQKFNFIIDQSKVSSQKKLDISNHTVYFPYQPYQAQINYMQKVIQSLDKKENAILESPTGTGKTLCLLSAALSWVQNSFWKSYKEVSIIYLSRTHSQLAQVSKELEKTCFRPTMAIFGSRQIFCIKEEFKQLKGRQKVQACSKAVKLYRKYGKEEKRHTDLKYDETEDEKSHRESIHSSKKKLSDFAPEQREKIEQTMCEYFKGQNFTLTLARQKFKNKIISTQTIKQLGKVHRFCPYYYPSFVKPICNFYLMPYNYLLDDDLNEKYKEIVKDSILIFDEAHNVAEASCEGRTFSINKKTFEDAEKQISKLIKSDRLSQQLYMVKNDFDYALDSLEQEIHRLLTHMTQFVSDTEFPPSQAVTQDDFGLKKLFRIHQTQQTIYEFLYESLSDEQTKIFTNLPNNPSQRELIRKMIKQIEKPILILSDLCQSLSQTPDGIFQNMEKVVGFVKKCIKLIDRQNTKLDWIQREVNHYRVVVNKTDKSWEVSVVCLVPFLTMKSIVDMKPHNIILTSGTLSPIDIWESELGIPFPIKFINTHVISPRQLMLRIVTGQEKSVFNFSYKSLQETFKTIYQSTLRAIISLAEKIPNGMLVVTPSYKIMSSIERCLQYNSDLKKQLNNSKKVFMETRDNFEDLIKKFKKAAVQQKGALLFCVCRGKISEGIDFPNELCRSVIFIGIPFPNVSDIILSEKKNHYDKIRLQEPSYKFSGNKWYQSLTFRSVNQAIGRVIRHINDFGSIFLIDIRYNMPGYKSQLPKWAQSSLQTVDLNNEVLRELETFYQKMETEFGNYQGKYEKQKHKEQSYETDGHSQEEKPRIKREQKPGQKYEGKVQKVSFPNKLFSKQPSVQPQKNIGKNAFNAIMGTDQNKFVKKKSNLGANPNKDF